jgi:hypothetical protein
MGDVVNWVFPGLSSLTFIVGVLVLNRKRAKKKVALYFLPFAAVSMTLLFISLRKLGGDPSFGELNMWFGSFTMGLGIGLLCAVEECVYEWRRRKKLPPVSGRDPDELTARVTASLRDAFPEAFGDSEEEDVHGRRS